MSRQQPLRPHPRRQQTDQLPVGNDPSKGAQFRVSLELHGKQFEAWPPMLSADAGNSRAANNERLDLLRIEGDRRHLLEGAIGPGKKRKR